VRVYLLPRWKWKWHERTKQKRKNFCWKFIIFYSLMFFAIRPQSWLHLTVYCFKTRKKYFGTFVLFTSGLCLRCRWMDKLKKKKGIVGMFWRKSHFCIWKNKVFEIIESFQTKTMNMFYQSIFQNKFCQITEKFTPISTKNISQVILKGKKKLRAKWCSLRHKT
jgi:hypothetical protein